MKWSLNHPKKVTLNHQVVEVESEKNPPSTGSGWESVLLFGKNHPLQQSLIRKIHIESEMMVWKMIFLYTWVMFCFHVNLPGCIQAFVIPQKSVFSVPWAGGFQTVSKSGGFLQATNWHPQLGGESTGKKPKKLKPQKGELNLLVGGFNPFEKY